MKKSQLKTIIREVIEEVVNESKITSSERRKISNEIHKVPELGGNIKVPSLGVAINKLAKALDGANFVLDMVSGDILLGGKGQRLLPFRRKSTSQDPFDEGVAIENSRISFNWDILSSDMEAPLLKGDKKYEVVVYVT